MHRRLIVDRHRTSARIEVRRAQGEPKPRPKGARESEGCNRASTLERRSPELLKVVERAQREPEGRFHSLAHLIDVSALERAYHRMRKDAAVGVDGVTKEQYGQALEAKR